MFVHDRLAMLLCLGPCLIPNIIIVRDAHSVMLIENHSVSDL